MSSPRITITNEVGPEISVEAWATLPVGAIMGRSDVTMADVEEIEVIVKKAPGSEHEVDDAQE